MVRTAYADGRLKHFEGEMGAPGTIPPEHRIQCGLSRVGGAVGAERKVRTQFPDGGTQYDEGERSLEAGDPASAPRKESTLTQG